MNTKNAVKIIEINYHGEGKNIDLGGVFKNKDWNMLLHLERIVAWNLVLRCQVPRAIYLDGLQYKGEKRGGRYSTTYVTKLISPVKGIILISFISLSWESDLRKIQVHWCQL